MARRMRSLETRRGEGVSDVVSERKPHSRRGSWGTSGLDDGNCSGSCLGRFGLSHFIPWHEPLPPPAAGGQRSGLAGGDCISEVSACPPPAHGLTGGRAQTHWTQGRPPGPSGQRGHPCCGDSGGKASPGPQGWRGLEDELTLPGASSQGRPQEPPCGCSALLPHGHCGHSLTQQAAHSEGGCGRTPCSVPAVRDPSGAPTARQGRTCPCPHLPRAPSCPTGPRRPSTELHVHGVGGGNASLMLISTSVRGLSRCQPPSVLGR